MKSRGDVLHFKFETAIISYEIADEFSDRLRYFLAREGL